MEALVVCGKLFGCDYRLVSSEVLKGQDHLNY